MPVENVTTSCAHAGRTAEVDVPEPVVVDGLPTFGSSVIDHDHEPPTLVETANVTVWPGGVATVFACTPLIRQRAYGAGVGDGGGGVGLGDGTGLGCGDGEGDGEGDGRGLVLGDGEGTPDGAAVGRGLDGGGAPTVGWVGCALGCALGAADGLVNGDGLTDGEASATGG